MSQNLTPIDPSTSHALVTLPPLLWTALACAAASIGAIVLARVLRLDSFARTLFAPVPGRNEIVTTLEQFARLAAARDVRSLQRAADQCPWRLFRRAARMLAENAEPAEIAQQLEHLSDTLAGRRARSLHRASTLALGFVVFPLGVLVAHFLGTLGVLPPSSNWGAGLALSGAIGLLLFSSIARWMCERALDSRVHRAVETETVIFALSAIRGGAEPEEIASMTRLMLGMTTPQSPLRRAA